MLSIIDFNIVNFIIYVYYPHFDGGWRRSVFEMLAEVALQIRPTGELLLAFIYNQSHSATQSDKNSRRND